MQRKIYLIYILLSLFTATAHSQNAAVNTQEASAAKTPLEMKYTKEHPLVYEDVWDLLPYSYQDDSGEPTGFNIELMKLILGKLNIPYVIKLKHSPENFEDVRTGKADLTIGMKANYHDRYAKYGSAVVALFTHSVVAPKTMNINIRDFDDLRGTKVIVHQGSFCHNMMLDNGMANNAIPMDDMRAALLQVNDNEEGMVLWNTLSLQTLIKKYDLQNLKIATVSMQYGEYHFMSNDTILLHQLDSVYTELFTREELLPLRRKWYYPNTPEEEETSSEYIWYIVIPVVVILLILLLSNIYYKIEKKRIQMLSEQQSKRLTLLLKTRNVLLWTYDVGRKTFTIIDPTAARNEEYNTNSFAVFYDQKDFWQIIDSMNRIVSGITKSKTLNVKSRSRDRSDNDMHSYELNLSILRSEGGRPSVILGVQRDMTDERLRLIETHDFLLKYKTVFNTAMADLAYYDKDGYLNDINERACETYQISDREAFIRQRSHISEMPMFRSLNGNFEHQVWTSTIIDLSEMSDDEIPKYWGRRDRMCYEYVIVPVYDDRGTLLCYVAAGQDMTDEAKVDRKEKQRMNKIKDATEEIRQYTDNINYALDVSKARLANYYPDRGSMVVTHDMNKPKLRLSQVRCLKVLAPHYRDKAADMMLSMDKGRLGQFETRVKTTFKEDNRMFSYYDINGLPMHDADGKITHYFCLCRNVTDLVETERMLEAETKKAQEAEVLKNSFLMNMSYQVRTPLNAVVGFAELFSQPHEREDEPIFIEEIKQNSDKLLSLVNNILLLSRLDARMVEITPTPTDIVDLLKTYSMMGWGQGLHEGVETIVESSYDRLVLDIDAKNLGDVVETLVELSVKKTEKGHIRTRCNYRNGTLTIVVEDTGPGIAQQALSDLRRRIFPNDGEDNYMICLRLQICDAFMELMGGKMEIESHLGKGTTVWLTLPCKIVEGGGIL